ncbi:hypothetical protein I302_107029 [Kwoniella bestiolae CBS 10118]|uniref:Uncharacterized protein n=1 Tax=Kwoniella bestiolae CBS 10118 TaxID=1296100 RepID=A0A1B9FZP6_9TREE|nr:hypothetical protein I302_05706 [Kwoniella bestiolae CBS 10118]OCF24247.1 hypothetical protein I302_05706 [Kwoniella bestiolae CBS 10118]
MSLDQQTMSTSPPPPPTYEESLGSSSSTNQPTAQPHWKRYRATLFSKEGKQEAFDKLCEDLRRDSKTIAARASVLERQGGSAARGISLEVPFLGYSTPAPVTLHEIIDDESSPRNQK